MEGSATGCASGHVPVGVPPDPVRVVAAQLFCCAGHRRQPAAAEIGGRGSSIRGWGRAGWGKETNGDGGGGSGDRGVAPVDGCWGSGGDCAGGGDSAGGGAGVAAGGMGGGRGWEAASAASRLEQGGWRGGVGQRPGLVARLPNRGFGGGGGDGGGSEEERCGWGGQPREPAPRPPSPRRPRAPPAPRPDPTAW